MYSSTFIRLGHFKIEQKGKGKRERVKGFEACSLAGLVYLTYLRNAINNLATNIYASICSW